MSAAPDRSEIGPYLGRPFGIGGSSGSILDSRYKLSLTRTPPGVGRFLRKRHVCGAGPLGDRSLPGEAFGRQVEEQQSVYGTTQVGDSGWRDEFVRKTRQERGTSHSEARNERAT